MQRDFLMQFLLAATFLVYSGVMLWLGWRKFERLQLREVIVGESGLLSAAGPRRSRSWGWLRIRPKGELTNLVRKEVRLHRPLFVVGGVYVVCWLAALAVNWLLPLRGYEALYVVLPGTYVPVAVLLAGAISLGEERTLGLAAWHLTLPVSARRQWLVKLAVAAAVAIGLAVVLPGLLALATLPEVRQQLHTSEPFRAWFSPGVALGTIFALSFWAATMLGNTMRAAVAAILGSGVLVLCFVLAHWCADQYGGLELETGLFCTLTAWRHLPMGFFHGVDLWLWWSLATPAVLVSLVALGQSLAQFRRAQFGSAVVAKCAALLLALQLVAAFWCADLKVSANSDYAAPLRFEVAQALCALPYKPDDISGPGRADRALAIMERTPAPAVAMVDKASRVHLTVADLERVFPLSARARRWLSEARLSMSIMKVIEARKPPRTDFYSRYGLARPMPGKEAPRQNPGPTQGVEPPKQAPDQAPRTDLYGLVRIQFPNYSLQFSFGVWQDGHWEAITPMQWVWEDSPSPREQAIRDRYDRFRKGRPY